MDTLLCFYNFYRIAQFISSVNLFWKLFSNFYILINFGIIIPFLAIGTEEETLSIFDTPAFHLDDIASSQKIKVGRRSLPNDINFSRALLFRGNKEDIHNEQEESNWIFGN